MFMSTTHLSIRYPGQSQAAVALNVTATQASAGGYVTAYPAGLNRPTVSNINLTANATAPNMVIVPLGGNGAVEFFSSGGTHLLADVLGYFSSATTSTSGRLVPVSPTRVFDTRTGAAPSGALAGGAEISVEEYGVGGGRLDGEEGCNFFHIGGGRNV